MPKRSTRYFRFKLSTLLAVVAIFAISFVGLRYWLNNRPIQWVKYSSQAFDKQIGNNSPIVVFAGADWDVNSLAVKRLALENQELIAVIRERSVVAFYADLTSGSTEVMTFLRRIDRSPTPTVVVYFRGETSAPVVLDGLVSADQIIRAIRTVSGPEPPQDGG